MTIKRIVESYNLVISPRRIPGHVQAVSALEYIFNKYGYQVLDRTVFLAVSTWEGEVDSMCSNMLKGIAKLVVAYGDQMKDDQFIERLGKVSIRELIRTAKDRHAGTQGYAEALLLYYNKRLKYPLRWGPLTSSSGQNSDRYDSDEGFFADGEYPLMDAEEAIPENGAEDEDDFFEDDEGIPNRVGALPEDSLMDNLGLVGNG